MPPPAISLPQAAAHLKRHVQPLWKMLAQRAATACWAWRLQAAVTVARRVAQERGVEVGAEVGYAVRFEERSSRRTKIKYLTGGWCAGEPAGLLLHHSPAPPLL